MIGSASVELSLTAEPRVVQGNRALCTIFSFGNSRSGLIRSPRKKAEPSPGGAKSTSGSQIGWLRDGFQQRKDRPERLAVHHREHQDTMRSAAHQHYHEQKSQSGWQGRQFLYKQIRPLTDTIDRAAFWNICPACGASETLRWLSMAVVAPEKA